MAWCAVSTQFPTIVATALLRNMAAAVRSSELCRALTLHETVVIELTVP